jgi:transposase
VPKIKLSRFTKELERENPKLRLANEMLKKASAYFAMAQIHRPFRK